MPSSSLSFNLIVQIAFTFVVFPCLLFAYMGQAAYLMKYPDSYTKIFYASVPGDSIEMIIYRMETEFIVLQTPIF